MPSIGIGLIIVTVVMISAACSGTEGTDAATETASEATTSSSTEAPVGPVGTETSVPDQTTTAATSDDRGTREAPAAAGEAVRVGEWDVTVLSATPDATDAVLAENEFNDPPAEGRQFFVVEVSATYEGDESEALFTGLTMSTVGDSAVAYEAFEDTCGVVPDELDTFSEVFPGGSQVGNVCWQVETSDADSLVLIVDDALSFDQDRAYMALE